MNINVKDTLECGQCFRFSEEKGVYTLYAGVDENVRKIKISQNNLDVVFKDLFWKNYFDAEADYMAMQKTFENISPVMKTAIESAPGIRILNQNSWEALCSFVVSQNNNIPRIKGIIDRMCKAFGKQNEDGDFGFPSSATLANVSEDSLRAVGLGFRAPYIINTARAVEDGSVNFNCLKNDSIEIARKSLVKVKGIGPKVANCALLFGCHRLDCFPIDTWMKKVMEKYFENCDESVFGQYAGLAQQYLFYWIRNGENKNDF